MTVVDEGKTGTFIIISNDTSHAAGHTQTQSYEPAFLTENTDYDKEHTVRSEGGGNELRLDTLRSMAPYHSGMAALIQLGNWFDCLRECGYQDHYRGGSRPRCGKIRSAICRRVLRLGKHGDINACDPLFLVKYFNSTVLTTDIRFMTNEDTPAIAF